MNETTPSEGLERLKSHLRSLTFARIQRVVARDEHLMSFVALDGFEWERNEPGFDREKAKLSAAEYAKTRKTYYEYYAFTETPNGTSIFLGSKGHSWQGVFTTELGIKTDQHPLEAPKVSGYVIGKLGTATEKGERFNVWSHCTIQEMIFANMLLGKERLTEKNIGRLYIQSMSEDRLQILARILILHDVEFFLKERQFATAPMATDCKVFEICNDYDMKFWEEYKERGLGQRIYSDLIPKPSPKPIVDNHMADSVSSVGINTPFGTLRI